MVNDISSYNIRKDSIQKIYDLIHLAQKKYDESYKIDNKYDCIYYEGVEKGLTVALEYIKKGVIKIGENHND